MLKAVIHIGANKTGSTTLQRRLFPKAQGLVYLGEDGAGYASYRETLNSLIVDDDLYFAEAEARHLFQEARARASASGQTMLLSSEDIMTSRVPSLCARRLHACLPEAHILLIVRNQLTAIPSWYANHGAYLKQVPRRYWRRYVSFDDWIRYCLEFIKYSPLDSYFYHRIVSLYVALFGQENIHILFYEDWGANAAQFVSDLCAVLHIDPTEAARLLAGQHERRRNTQRGLYYHRARSWLGGRDIGQYLPAALQARWAKFLAGGPPANGFISEMWRQRLAELYQTDNARLAQNYGLDLKSRGYPLPPEGANPTASPF